MSIAALLNDRFINRHDAKAWQKGEGYLADKTELTLSDIEAHLSGDRTLGHYIVNPTTQECKVVVFDIDLAKTGQIGGENGELVQIKPREVFADVGHPERLSMLATLKLNAYGIASRLHRKYGDCGLVASTFSGSKGMHVYLLLDEPALAVSARQVAGEVLESLNFAPSRGDNFWETTADAPRNVCIEVFPKQDQVDPDAFGNLVRLPLGINQKSGKAGAFIRLDDQPTKMTRLDPTSVLQDRMLPWAI